MLKRKLSTIILIATISNLVATPINSFAETINTTSIIEESVQKNEVNVTEFKLYGNSKLESYNSLYKINNSNIKSITNNGGQYSNSSIDKAIDGSFSTHWETGKPNSTSFTNEVIVDFNEVESLNRIVYAARQDSAKGKGFAQEVEIYSSVTDEGNDFELVGTGTYTGSTGNVVEFKFENTKFKRVKFVFKKANQDWASSAEFMFYKEDAVLDKVDRLFTDNTMSVVSEEFNTIDTLNELEKEFESHPFYEDYKENFDNARALLNQEIIEATNATVSKFDAYYSDKRQAYDDSFKMDNLNIESITSSGGKLSGYVGTENIVDGKLDTYWETGKHTSELFKNELVFTLKENTVLNRIAYRSAWNTVGFAENFEIWASNTTKGDTFQLVSSATATKTADVVEIKFNPTSFKRIKFVFKNNGTATASEMMFYKEDEALDKVKTLFTDSTMSTVSEAFNTVDAINDLEEEFKLHPFYVDYKENFENARILLNQGKIEVSEAKVSKFEQYYSKYKNAYDEVYKMDNSNVESIYTNGGDLNYYSIKENMLDGDLNTYWETAKQNSDSFKNEIIFTLKKPTVLNRIAYRSAWNTVGFAENFEIWASNTTKGDTFQLVTTGSAKKTGDVIEIKFNPTEFKRIKFVYKNANSNKPTASEIMFYKEDKIYDVLNNMFTNGLMNKLTEEVNSLDKITALENELQEYPLKEQYMEQFELAKELLENPAKYQQGILTASQRGEINKEAREHQIARGTYNLDTFGKYVTPGETIKVYVDADINGVMPQLVLGQLANDKNGWTRFYTLKPGLNTIKAPEFSSMSPAVMYVYNPALPSDQAYAPRVRIEGGTAFPVYYHGKTDPADYERQLKEYTEKISIDDNDFANGLRDDVYYNVTELVSENNIITTSAAGALQGIKEMKSSNKTVADTMNDWEKLWHEFQRFSGFVEGDSDSRNDIYNSKFISRVFTKGPYGWSDFGYTGYNGGNTARRDSSNFKQIVKPFSLSDDWLFYHEWGHSINNSSTEEVEVTNNLYSAEMRRVFGTGGSEGDRIAWNELYSRFSGGTVNSGFFTNLGMISQPLYYYGIDTYGKASRIARTNPDGILNGLTSNKQRLVITYSLAVGYDLTDFFDGWNYCKATDLMKSKVAHLPKPDVKLEYMNTSGIGYEGQGFTGETMVYINSISSNSESKQTTLTFSVGESDKNDVMGYEILRNGEVVGYTTSTSFVDKNIDTNEDYTYEVIAYAKDLSTSKKATISSKTPTLLANSKITIKLNEEFNPLNYVNATDNLGNAISDIKVTHDVDTTKKGTYKIKYEVVSNGITVNKETIVEVVSDYDYLSDSNWTSARTDYDVVRKNNNLKLFVNGKVQSFAKGFGIHANGEIVYDLSGKNYEKFEAFIGVSRSIEAQNNSSIKFSILADNKEIYNSGLMKYADAAKFISLDVKGVKELKIVVNDAGNGISSDHAVIGNPILIDNNIKPTLTVGETETVKLRSDYDLMASVKATDIEDGDITKAVVVNENGFTIDKTGEYKVKYSVTDSDGNIVNAEKTVIVYSESEYLSDINWTSARTDWGTIKKDLALCGSKITLNVNGENKIFDKGVGTHANSEIVYNIEDKNYDYFETYVGVERTIAGAGKSSVIFKIYADGVEVYNSGIMKWEDNAKYVRVPVNGVSELKLVVNDAGNGIGSDHGDFGDAKFLTLNSLPKLNIPKSVSTKIGNPIELKEEYSAYDSEDGDLTDKIEVTGEVNFDKTGEYTLTYKVTDSDGNVVTKTRTVAVVDMKDYNYLTDYNWASENHSYATPLIDKSISAKALRLTDANGKEVTYSRGIGAHATSSIIYDLSNKNYDYFTAYVGVDRQMYESIGSVSFQVYVDGEKKFDSGLMNSKDPQKYVEVDINGAKELKLVVTDGGNGIGSDHGTWADTKLHYAKENGTVINKDTLVELIQTVNELEEELYSVESFNNLKTVLENVNKELANGYTQEEVDTLYVNLKEAYDKLVKLTNFSALQEVIDNNSNYNELHYYKAAMTAHKAVIEEAKAVLANKDATQEEVDAAVKKVRDSANSLVIRENKVELEKKIIEAKSIKNNNYNSARWNNFCYGIKYAEEVYNNVDATDQDITSSLFMLQYFKEELK